MIVFLIAFISKQDLIISFIEYKYTSKERKAYLVVFLFTNDGFSAKTAKIHIYDADTGELFHEYKLYVGPGQTASGTYSIVSGLWRQMGHENIRACVFLEGEDENDLDSTRYASFTSLEEIYLQDAGGILKSNGGNDEKPQPVEEVSPVTVQGEYRVPVTYVSEEPHESEPVVRPEKEEKPAETLTNENVQEPEEQAVLPEENKKTRGIWLLIPLIGGLLCLLLFFLLALFRKRKEEELTTRMPGASF